MYKKLNLVDAEKKMNLWRELSTEEYLSEELDKEYLDLRKRLLHGFGYIKSTQKYAQDYQSGLVLYKVLAESGFTMRDASNDDVWRFLSLCVIPDIVGKRWGKMAEIRYYKQSGRIWLKTIWWYIHLSWQGDLKSTGEIIEKNTTDQILQLVDRSGLKGYYIDVYRKIMHYYHIARQLNPEVGEEEFRKIMTLHTAMCRTVEPGLCEGEEDGYVRMIYDRLGVRLSEN